MNEILKGFFKDFFLLINLVSPHCPVDHQANEGINEFLSESPSYLKTSLSYPAPTGSFIIFPSLYTFIVTISFKKKRLFFLKNL
jgi:hypothetical protein